MVKIDKQGVFEDSKGNKLTKADVERWFVEGEGNPSKAWDRGVKAIIEERIDNRLKKLKHPDNKTISRLTLTGVEAERKILKVLKQNLCRVLLDSPRQLEKMARIYTSFINGLKFPRNTKVKKKKANISSDIVEVMAYKEFRREKLPILASKLNVKCCPYCNQHYTLVVEEERVIGKGNSKKVDTLAKLQFDHFFDKSSFPVLCMSLYNLIPSCASCNQGKSTARLSLNFHPYESDISEHLRFRVKDVLKVLTPRNGDLVEITVKATDPAMADEVKAYDEQFHLSSQYGRHLDIVQEIHTRLYVKDYYESGKNFGFLDKGHPDQDLLDRILFGNDATHDLLDRILFGNYPDPSDIAKRPLSKFTQDIHAQLSSLPVP